MSTSRPTPAAQVVAIATTLALIVTTFVIALAASAAGAYPHSPVEEPATTHTASSQPETTAKAAHGAAKSPSTGLLDPSVGRGADSKVCATSPKSPRCRIEGGSGLSLTRGGHALRPATDGPETLLKGEWDETGPADMPGRAPGRGGWVGEEGPSRA